MNNLKEFYEEKEEKRIDEELLSEDAVGIVMSIFAVPSMLALFGWIGSIIAVTYFRYMSRTVSKIVKAWRDLFQDIQTTITRDTVQETVEEISKDSKSRKFQRETKKNRRAFQEELREVYSAIESKDFNLARDEFAQTPKYIQNNPDVHRVLISEISKVLQEPPIYVSSPGNPTYQAIKKVINIRVAKAAAYATKITLERNLKKGTVSPEEEEV